VVAAVPKGYLQFVCAKFQALVSELLLWEGYLDRWSDGPYLCGAMLTLADLSFFPVLAYCVRCGLLLAEKGPPPMSSQQQGQGQGQPPFASTFAGAAGDGADAAQSHHGGGSGWGNGGSAENSPCGSPSMVPSVAPPPPAPGTSPTSPGGLNLPASSFYHPSSGGGGSGGSAAAAVYPELLLLTPGLPSLMRVVSFF
jgi:hypothetical protein